MIRVSKISVQPKGKYKPITLEPVELEVLSLKRAIVGIQVEESSKIAEIRGLLEFKGKALILAVVRGRCNVAEIARFLGAFYYERYNKHGIRGLSLRDANRICDCTLANPDTVLGFLHLIHNNGGLTVAIRTSSGFPLRHRREESFTLGRTGGKNE